MYLDTFSRRARSLATILIFARVRILGTQCLFVIATVTKVSRKRGLWLVVRVKKGDTRRYLHFYSFSSAASYVGMIQIRYTGLGDAANSQPDPSGSPVCLFSFFDKIYYILSERKSQVCTRFRT